MMNNVSTPPRVQWREPLTSPRRVKASQRIGEAIRLRRAGYTWQTIADHLHYADPSGPWRAIRRTCSRMDWDALKHAELKKLARTGGQIPDTQ